MSQQYEPGAPKPKRGLGCLSVLGIIIVTIAVTIAGTLWALNSSWLNGKFRPVELTESEQQTLSQKMEILSAFDATPDDDKAENSEYIIDSESGTPASQADDMQPEVYTADSSKRRIELSERELNALLAENTDLGEQLVVKLTDNMASIKLLFDVDPDFPFIGGKTLRISSGTELSYTNNRPTVIMKGVSVWGIPIPNAWLGDLKNVDLVKQFGNADGFWKSFSDGIENIRIEEGNLLIQLAE